jgi:hypothetical protein
MAPNNPMRARCRFRYLGTLIGNWKLETLLCSARDQGWIHCSGFQLGIGFAFAYVMLECTGAVRSVGTIGHYLAPSLRWRQRVWLLWHDSFLA